MGFQKKRVLIIDDNHAFLMQMCILMRKLGFMVKPAEDNAEALGPLNLQGVDLVLMNMHMSTQGGMKTLERLKGNKETSMIPVVVMSSDGRAETVTNCLENGASAFISKPIDINKLNQTLQNSLFGIKHSERKYLRIPFSGKVTLSYKKHVSEISAETLSERGIYLVTHKPLPVGAFVRSSFSLENGIDINQKGTVIYRTGLFELEAELPPGMAVEFKEDIEGSFMAINRFITRSLTKDISIYNEDSFI